MSAIEIPLGDGLVALADKADELLLAGFNWRPTRMPGHVYAHALRGNFWVSMHRLVIGAGPKQVVDHINRNGLDNRRANLRLASYSQNGANRVADNRKKGTTSQFKGVSFKSERMHWVAHIHVDGKTRYLGSFATEEEAALAYNVAASEAWGEYARLNIIEGVTVL